jgi:hypothetical protein
VVNFTLLSNKNAKEVILSIFTVILLIFFIDKFDILRLTRI